MAFALNMKNANSNSDCGGRRKKKLRIDIYTYCVGKPDEKCYSNLLSPTEIPYTQYNTQIDTTDDVR